MEQLNGIDSAMVLGEMPDIPLHIGAIFIYDPSSSANGTVKFGQVRNLLQNLIDESLPLLKCRVEKLPFNIDRPYWVEDKHFNLDYHLDRIAIPQPADWHELHQIAGRYHALPLDHDRPLWQALFIESLDHLEGLPSGCFGLIMKIHHALADGKTAVKLFSALHTLSPEPGAPLIYESMQHDEHNFTAPKLMSKYGRAYWHGISQPYKLMKSIADLTPKFIHARKEQAATQTPTTAFDKEVSADRITGHIRIPMKEIKHLEEASGTTINDIAFCIIAGAMAHYLQDNNALPKESLIAGMPIDVRAHDDHSGIGNQLSFTNLSLHTDITNPITRLKAIHKSTRESKKSIKDIGEKSLGNIFDNLYPGLLVASGKLAIKTKLVYKAPPLNNSVITNVPGIPFKGYLCGAELVDYIGLGLLAPTATLFHVISSIHSHVNISFLSCKTSLEDSDRYTRALNHSFEELLNAFPQ